MKPPIPATATGNAGQSPMLKAVDLFAAGPVVRIELGSDVYQLRLTRNGKLILTK